MAYIPYYVEKNGKTMQKYKAMFYEKPDGTKPTKEFLLKLDTKMKAKMLRTISLLEENGQDLREPYSKHLCNGIFELRAKVGTNISRVLYFFVVNKRAILTHGFVKKEDKTPQSQIDRAINYRREYYNRRRGNNNE